MPTTRSPAPINIANSSSPIATARRSGCRTSPTIVRGPENTKLGAWANTTPAIIINVQRQPGANIIQVVDRIQALLPQITAALPSAVDVAVLSNRTVTIRASVADVEFELSARRRAGRAGDLRLPAHAAGHHHPEPVGAAVARRHLRRDVSARLQPRQSVADGADDRHRLRRRRRHRHDREYRALRRRRHGPARSRAARLGADRLHHHFADDLADRGADPACCSWATWSAGCSTNSRSRSRSPSSFPPSCR